MNGQGGSYEGDLYRPGATSRSAFATPGGGSRASWPHKQPPLLPSPYHHPILPKTPPASAPQGQRTWEEPLREGPCAFPHVSKFIHLINEKRGRPRKFDNSSEILLMKLKATYMGKDNRVLEDEARLDAQGMDASWTAMKARASEQLPMDDVNWDDEEEDATVRALRGAHDTKFSRKEAKKVLFHRLAYYSMVYDRVAAQEAQLEALERRVLELSLRAQTLDGDCEARAPGGVLKRAKTHESLKPSQDLDTLPSLGHEGLAPSDLQGWERRPSSSEDHL